MSYHSFTMQQYILLYYTRHIKTALSLPCSIVRDYCEVIHLAGTEVVRSEVVVCFSDVNAFGTGNGCCIILICHIVDEDGVPDVRVNISDIQGEWSSP